MNIKILIVFAKDNLEYLGLKIIRQDIMPHIPNKVKGIDSFALNGLYMGYL